jgi:N-acetylglucosamine kinase-like BadF-type ATPase
LLVFQVAATGDPVAGEVIAWAGRELGSMVVGIVRQLAFQNLAFDVVLIGSMFNSGDPLLDPLKQVVLAEAPQARFIRLEVPPVIGGVLLGMQQAGLAWGDGIRLHLAESIRFLLPNGRQGAP